MGNLRMGGVDWTGKEDVPLLEVLLPEIGKLLNVRGMDSCRLRLLNSRR